MQNTSYVHHVILQGCATHLKARATNCYETKADATTAVWWLCPQQVSGAKPLVGLEAP